MVGALRCRVWQKSHSHFAGKKTGAWRISTPAQCHPDLSATGAHLPTSALTHGGVVFLPLVSFTFYFARASTNCLFPKQDSVVSGYEFWN